MINDTISAISTAFGKGAISIIRLSGDDAIAITNKFFRGKNLSTAKSHTITYGHIFDGENQIDEVLVSIFKKPNTFTKEDVVEINCHGGIYVANKILELTLKNGARAAEGGEFTKRAYLNGRIDLTQVKCIKRRPVKNALARVTRVVQTAREKRWDIRFSAASERGRWAIFFKG